VSAEESLELLRLLEASGDKVRLWVQLDGGHPVELSDPTLTAADAVIAVKATAATAVQFGKTPSFSVRRFEP